MGLSAQGTITYDDRAGLSHWIVSDILQDRHGFIWLATWNGLNRYDGYEFKQVKAKPGDGTSIQSDVIRRIILNADGNIVCRSEAGIFCFNTHTYSMQDIATGTSYKGIMEHSPQTFTDAEGNTWSIRRYGIDKAVRLHHPATIVDGTQEVHARAFMKDGKKRWWLATKEDECIRLYDSSNRLIGFLGNDGKTHHTKTPFGYRAYSIMTARNGDVWIGCKPGALLRLRERADGSFDVKRITHPQLTCDIIYHIIQDRHGRLWMATFGKGVMCIVNPEDEAPECVNFTDRLPFRNSYCRVRRILTTQDDKIVCATTNGLIIGTIDNADVKKSTFKRLVRDGKRAESLSANAIMDVLQHRDGRIYIATENNGINVTDEKTLFSDKTVFAHFNVHNSSLSSDACLAMTENNNGNIFLVCTDRILEFNPRDDTTVTFSRLFWNSECHFSEERPMQLFDRSWLFGQEQGAYIATQHNLYTRGYTPPLVFTELHIRGRQPFLGVCAKDTITLDTDERAFSISFAALDFTDNSGINYRSRINGGAWSNASGERTLTFHDMRPGTYTLEVQSTDRYGRWVANNRTLIIVVKPYWYETLWATLLGCLLIIIIITGVVYTIFYVRDLRRQRHELLNKYMALLAQADDRDHNIAEQGTKSIDSLPSNLSDSDRRFLERVRTYINANISNSDANIDNMAMEAATSRSNLNRKLRSLVGITATQLLIDARMQRAQTLLRNAQGSEKTNISDIAYRCGYSDPRYFSRCFKQRYGVSPSEFK
jgi:AraC-like DNA-binding protein